MHGIIIGLGLGVILLGPEPIVCSILGLSLIAIGFILERKGLKKEESEKEQ